MKSVRLNVHEVLRLRPNDWSSLEVVLLECSATDFVAICEAKLRPGFVVSLEIPNVGPTPAHVRWCRADSFGATFWEPLDLSRAGFHAIRREALLARLLKERAAADSAGDHDRELELRLRIRNALPIQRIAG